MKNLRRLIISMLIVLLANLNIFSQKIILDTKNNDSLICYTKEQSKFFIRSYYLFEEKDSLLKLSETQINVLEKIIKKDGEIRRNFLSIVSNKEKELNIKDEQISDLKENLSLSERKIKKQRVFLKTSIATNLLLAFLFIIK